MSPDDATWEYADFIKFTFPDFFNQTIRSWFPQNDPSGQGSSSGTGNCQDPNTLHLLSEEFDTYSEEFDTTDEATREERTNAQDASS